MGIMKTLGYTSGQIIMSIVLSYFPFILIPALIGSLLGYFVMTDLIRIIISSMGIMSLKLKVLPSMLIQVTVFLTLAGLLTTLAQSAKIRKLTSYELLMK